MVSLKGFSQRRTSKMEEESSCSRGEGSSKTTQLTIKKKKARGKNVLIFERGADTGGGDEAK